MNAIQFDRMMAQIEQQSEHIKAQDERMARMELRMDAMEETIANQADRIIVLNTRVNKLENEIAVLSDHLREALDDIDNTERVLRNGNKDPIHWDDLLESFHQ